MKETTIAIGEAAQEAGPQGIGMAVAFDWGLSAQLLATPFLALIPGVTSPFIRLGLNLTLTTMLSLLIVLPFASLIAIFGEGIRRGWKWTRPIQVIFNTLGFVGGLVTLVNVWQSSRQGNYWPVVTAVILLIFSPLIAWRLSRPRTAYWFATVKSSDARRRHGGAWPFLIAIWALVGGILQALAALSR
ncbi:MAG: hypothetical protein M3Y39_14635 [Chloroflexota bacterium]|nr:hypothetical protein [Chloroflexota bacterium]